LLYPHGSDKSQKGSRVHGQAGILHGRAPLPRVSISPKREVLTWSDSQFYWGAGTFYCVRLCLHCFFCLHLRARNRLPLPLINSCNQGSRTCGRAQPKGTDYLVTYCYIVRRKC
jgi:hypothetical protein